MIFLELLILGCNLCIVNLLLLVVVVIFISGMIDDDCFVIVKYIFFRFIFLFILRNISVFLLLLVIFIDFVFGKKYMVLEVVVKFEMKIIFDVMIFNVLIRIVILDIFFFLYFIVDRVFIL